MRKIHQTKEVFKTLERKVNQKTIDVYLFIKRDHSGSAWIEEALKIAIICVIGALVAAGLYTLFKDNIMPTISGKSTSMFNYGG